MAVTRLLVLLAVFALAQVAISSFTFNAAKKANWDSRHLPLWPYPSSVSHGTDGKYVQLVKSSLFQIKLVGDARTSVILKEASKRYKSLFFPFLEKEESREEPISLAALEVSTESGDEVQLKYGVDESYTLTVTAERIASLHAKTVYGALRGLETFSQLVEFNEGWGRYFINSLPIEIDDSPRFPWRGILLDTSRHFMPVSYIYTLLDQLAQNKYNVFHWHIMDAESFPLQSEVYPLLSERGAYDSISIYTKDEVKSVVEYARLRGIRVVPEFDMPGHSFSWSKGHPEIFSNCPRTLRLNSYAATLDPFQNKTMAFLQNLLNEWFEVFPDKFWHLGGDEVSHECWLEDPEIAEYVRVHNLQGRDLEAIFIKNVAKLFPEEYGRVYWEEAFKLNHALDPETDIVQVWLDDKLLGAAARAGYRVLTSIGLYLDRQRPRSVFRYAYADTWREMYWGDPIRDGRLEGADAERVIGGEVTMWTEKVDADSLDYWIWPRTAAAGEALWSPSLNANSDNEGDVAADHAAWRLERMRCRMAARGTRAFPIYPGRNCLKPSNPSN